MTIQKSSVFALLFPILLGSSMASANQDWQVKADPMTPTQEPLIRLSQPQWDEKDEAATIAIQDEIARLARVNGEPIPSDLVIRSEYSGDDFINGDVRYPLNPGDAFVLRQGIRPDSYRFYLVGDRKTSLTGIEEVGAWVRVKVAFSPSSKGYVTKITKVRGRVYPVSNEEN